MHIENNRRILIVDDNRAIHDDFRKILTSQDDTWAIEQAEARALGIVVPVSSANEFQTFEIDSAYQGQEGWEKVRTSVDSGKHYAVAFVDMRMPPGWDGVETIAKIWEVDSEIQVVICTAYSDYSWEEIMKKLGNVDRLLILKKPFDTAEVCQLACALTQKWHLARQAHLKLSQLRAMVDERTSSLQAEVLEHRRSEEALRLSQGRYALAVAGANDGIWDWDFPTSGVFYSPRWKTMLGLTEDQVAPVPSEWFNRIHPDDLERVKVELNQHVAGNSSQFCSEYRMRHQDGHYRWILSRGVAVRDETGKALRAAGSQTDITDRKMAEEQLHHAALHDVLTGLANRALLLDRIEQCARRARRSSDQTFAVIFMDLDRFKVINDSLGHSAGDKLLIQIARRLVAAVRDADTVARSESNYLARLGGDEFVLLLDTDTIRTPADAVRVAERLVRALCEPFHIEGQEVVASASLGIALNCASYERPEDILRDADTAMYSAKKSGGGRYQIFDPAMHASAMQRLWMEGELRRAIDRGELRLLYQPIRSLANGKLAEVEALVRWQHPQRGTISPIDFIPLAEETGLILPLGSWVLKEACRQLKQWQTQIPELADLTIGVNVSARQFARLELADEVAQVLNETKLDPRHLKLEITETALMENGSPAMVVLTKLRKIGVQFHLDDFGTGYSSLGYLHRMPIEALKIDRTFIAAMGTDRTGTSIVQAIVALAHSLNMKVIAEGVENESQLEYLKDIGCNYAQGYYFAKPLPASDIADLVKSIGTANAA